MIKRLLVILLVFPVFMLFSQQDTPKGYILSIDGEIITLDYTQSDVKVGDLLKVIKPGKYIVHPVTGESIKKKDTEVARLEITLIEDSYSEAAVHPRNAISQLEAGMRVLKLTDEEAKANPIKNSIAIHSLNVMGAEGTYLGLYMADLLTISVYESNNFRVIDRTILDAQMNEMNMGISGYIQDDQAVNYGRIAGADYFIVGNVDVEVRETGNTVPIKGTMQLAELISGKDLGSQYFSNVKMKQLSSIAKVTLRVVDVSTGEIKFICSEMAKANGKGSVELEGGILGGAQLNGGATDFLKTVSGKATQQAIYAASGYIQGYFAGSITKASYTGNIVSFGSKTEYKKDHSKSVVDIHIIEFNDEDKTVILDKGNKSELRKNKPRLGKIYNVFTPKIDTSNITYEKDIGKMNFYGKVTVLSVDQDVSKGSITSEKDIPIDRIIKNNKLKCHAPIRIELFPISGIFDIKQFSNSGLTKSGKPITETDFSLSSQIGIDWYPDIFTINNHLWTGVSFNYIYVSTLAYDTACNGYNLFPFSIELGFAPYNNFNIGRGLYFGTKYYFVKNEIKVDATGASNQNGEFINFIRQVKNAPGIFLGYQTNRSLFFEIEYKKISFTYYGYETNNGRFEWNYDQNTTRIQSHHLFHFKIGFRF